MAVAKDQDPRVRNIHIRDTPKDEAEQVYVTGRVVTVLRLQQPCDPARTKMLGWEGRFEPIECVGNWVLLEPLQNLEPEDRFLLLVTLADGKELPFTVTSIGKKEWERPDQQVNVFLEPESRDALQAELKATRQREEELMESVYRHFREDTADHALAKILTTGAIQQTSFVERRKRIVKTDDGAELVVRIFAGKQKAAVVLTVTNRHPSKSWSLAEARLLTTRPGEDLRAPFLFGEAKPFALRTDRDEIAPGQSGTVAVVVDRSAFRTDDGFVNTLALEFYRQDGFLDTYVLLDRRLVRE
ncbi:uncharacterized protein (TIGR02268 family) [Archangium gephyra]|uniref:Uncharacterized protein (TIGR02268 family) n=2 Tax=Archangium gephyra TaxID=48 RepID=A0ABX9K0Y0_9BACT|nr:uncharacterized protein (TIGR02268 family) [Archangium gephyra]